MSSIFIYIFLVTVVTEMLVNVLNIHSEEDDEEPGWLLWKSRHERIIIDSSSILLCVCVCVRACMHVCMCESPFIPSLVCTCNSTFSG